MNQYKRCRSHCGFHLIQQIQFLNTDSINLVENKNGWDVDTGGFNSSP